MQRLVCSVQKIFFSIFNLGLFKELFTIQKTIASSNEQGLLATRHAGYIVTCFKILDNNCKVRVLCILF